MDEITQLVIDCRDGSAVELVLDEDEARPILASRTQVEAQAALESRRESALLRLRFRAVSDPLVADLLTALGLEGG